jgi:hypothetical protein
MVVPVLIRSSMITTVRPSTCANRVSPETLPGARCFSMSPNPGSRPSLPANVSRKTAARFIPPPSGDKTTTGSLPSALAK